MPFNKKLAFLFFLLFVMLEVYAQSYRFRRYNIDDGLCHNFIYSIAQSKDGYLWIGTGEDLCTFNGIEFNNNIIKDSISSAYICCIYKDKSDNLWFGHSDGSIGFYDGTVFSDLSSDSVTSMIVCISEDDNGNILFATQNEGIIKVNSKKQSEIINRHLQNKVINKTFYIGNNKLLLGTDNGLFLYQYTDKEIKEIPDFQLFNISSFSLAEKENNYIIGTANNGIYKITISDDNTISFDSILVKGNPLKNLNIQCIYKDNASNLWLSTFGKGAYKLHYDTRDKKYTAISQYNENNGLGSQYVKCIYQDKEGNMWFGTYGQGLSLLTDQAFVFYHYNNQTIKDNVTAVLVDNDTHWVGGTNGLLKKTFGENETEILYNKQDGLANIKVSSIYKDPNKNLWIGTKEHGIYILNIKTGIINHLHYKTNSLSNAINQITGRNNNVLVATKNGIFYYDIETKNHEHFTTIEGLPHNNINDIYLNDEGELFYATKANGIYSLNSDKSFDIESNIEIEFTCITKDQKGNIWAGTYGNGVFKFLTDSLIFLSTEQGLKSNYCYSIICDDSNNVWVGHHLGLSRISSELNIKQYGPNEGFKGNCNANAIYHGDKIYWGTTNGLISYDISKDKGNKTPPITSLQSVTINNKEYNTDKNIYLNYGIYKVRFDFIGVNFKAPKQVSYKYKLDGFDMEWNDFTSENYAKYPRLEDGNYTFILKACNEKNICTQKPVKFGIEIKKPIWKTWWFILLSIALLVFIVILIIKYREKKQIKFQEYLKKLLDDRTATVTKQKEELESKNKSITESIKYAKRIQSSLLPSIDLFRNTFSNSFIFYRPRDIVSGDFFWFRHFKDSRYLVVCSDCTGHGVPGSLVSMIGITHIKDICNNKNVQTPAELLQVLQVDFQETLKQEYVDPANIASDGMDISVADIDIKNYFIRFSSAMRPVLIKTKDDIIHIRGTKTPIGGVQVKLSDEAVHEYENYEIQLEKGDIIYMFSDGYIDQFGGSEGKKFMIGRFKKCIKEVADLPMDEQYTYFKNKFYDWKGENSQIDDVLVMGIKL